MNKPELIAASREALVAYIRDAAKVVPVVHRRHYADSFISLKVDTEGRLTMGGYAEEIYPVNMRLEDAPLIELAHLATTAGCLPAVGTC